MPRWQQERRMWQRAIYSRFSAFSMLWQRWRSQAAETIGRLTVQGFFPAPAFGERFDIGYHRFEDNLTHLAFDQEPELTTVRTIGGKFGDLWRPATKHGLMQSNLPSSWPSTRVCSHGMERQTPKEECRRSSRSGANRRTLDLKPKWSQMLSLVSWSALSRKFWNFLCHLPIHDSYKPLVYKLNHRQWTFIPSQYAQLPVL